ncbi:LuxR C-terminal-related transcriptional regulator [Umezawaea endophytica]|uniref:LuxR C-terminal-related transcriptional regulator n=1 Tax=Umezawaea endophytica TaxID=1654476 RepID=A0A9X2VRE9_9PSEU|nr:LuxR C-terminal-related transcriptional regulator [Umezawaea endophytica]MCS7481271.1 LuxR C-terminal-related transcriptional regulator [Umezawaea endophytica]
MAFIIEMIFRDAGDVRRSIHVAHRDYWKRLADQGVLIGGGLVGDGSAAMLLCQASDEQAVRELIRADPYIRSHVIAELRVRQWHVLMGVPQVERPEPALVRPRDGQAVDAIDHDPLTPHERRIALMMLEGKTNRQIAEHFSVSTRAVELHITRIYRKLEIGRRAQLAAAMSWGQGQRSYL